ncbi:MAG: GIY-YIG nuclease family protein [Candidatus Abawacabacteria bacterium]|nr:GIY-YIG nuclease family protein [Candidatus Abawacabacteria bacterium]
MWYVYFLENKQKQFFYTGSTNSLSRRLFQHQNGYVISTRRFLPLELVGYIALPTEKQARELEQYFKTGSGKTVLRKRILNT